MKISSARKTAVEVLDRYGFKDQDVGLILNSRIGETDDKGVLRDLVMGVVRNKAAIDNITEVVCKVEAGRMNKRVANVVRVGVYELVYTSSPAEYAVINEAVNVAHEVSSKKSANFVNAVLRNVQRAILNFDLDKAVSQRRDLPIEPRRFVSFNVGLLPDPKENPTGYLWKAFSIPPWLANEWVAEYGFVRAAAISLAQNRRPSVYAWANKLVTGVDELAGLFSEDGIESTITLDGNGLKIRTHKAINYLRGFSEGLFTIQDLTAAKVVWDLELEPEPVIVDLCSAPGGKTAGLAMRYPDARIIATDTSAERLKMVGQMCQRLSLGNVEVVKYKHLANEVRRLGKIDLLVADVPCSNTGVMARRVEVRHRLRPESIDMLSKIQGEILTFASTLEPKQILYSTCSIERAENRSMVEKFLGHFKKYKLIKEELTLPSAKDFDHDGGYFALLSK